MRGDELLIKMELVDPVYLDAADKNPGAKKRGWLKYGAIAACLCLLIAGGISEYLYRQSSNTKEKSRILTAL